MKTTIITILVCAFYYLGIAQENDNLKVKGFVDTYHAVSVKESNDLMASRSRFRGELEKLNGNSYFFASVNAVYNGAMPELSKIQFREAYLEYTGKKWGIKAGRQIITWGKADGLKITDVISPMDLTEFLAQDYDDIRMPVNGLVLSRFSKNWELDLVCVPVFESYILPGANNPWGFDYTDIGLVKDDALTPDFNLSNMEYGGKLSFYLSGIDFEFSALNTWNKAPVYSYHINDSSVAIHITPEHHRMGFVGFGFSKSLNAFIIRGESAFNFNKKFSPKPEYFHVGLLENNSFNYLLGIDWYPGGEWTVTGQFSDEYILDCCYHNASDEHTYISTLGITKKVLHSTLSLSTFGYFGLNECDFFNRTSADYSLSDNIHVLAGFDWFYGDSGMFGRYSDNSQVWLKAKFSF
ncbi:MAG: hypothetical protein MI922_06365 [Bacteroidales bacterium]|nr:hypothetical protein [Bacteroidales bacterium]